MLYADFREFPFRDCMKTPDRCRSGTPPSAENGLRGLYFGVWCYRRPTIGASPATFHTVSLRGWVNKDYGSRPKRALTSGMRSLQSSSDKTRPIPNRLDVFQYGNIMAAMARAATTSDAFNAIAEQQRRDILALLRAGERPVTDLAQELGMSQPRASKHLRVLREVGLVRVRGAGKQRLYGLDARGLRPVHEWVGGFERFWSERFDRLDEYVQELKQARQEGPHDGDDQ